MILNYKKKASKLHSNFTYVLIIPCFTALMFSILGLRYHFHNISDQLFYIIYYLGLTSLIIVIGILLHECYLEERQLVDRKLSDLSSIQKLSINPSTEFLSENSYKVHVKQLLNHSVSKGCLALIHLEGLDNNTTLTYRKKLTKKISAQYHTLYTTLSSNYKGHILIGYKSSCQLYFFLYQVERNDCEHELSHIIEHLEKELSLSIHCGYIWCNEQPYTNDRIFDYTQYALYESMYITYQKKNEFSLDSYLTHQQTYKKNAAFDYILKNNLFSYHYQPIVDARNGTIMGYESLMRTSKSVSLTPTEILRIAEEKSCLDQIEYATFYNLLQIIDNSIATLGHKKLFINSIPGHSLQLEDSVPIQNKYSHCMEHLVIEYHSSNQSNFEHLQSIQAFAKALHCESSYDCFQETALRSILQNTHKPIYLRINCSSFLNIQTNAKEKEVRNKFISFCKKNHVKLLVEGIESKEELKQVLQFPVDYLQGFFIAPPNSRMIGAIDADVQALIITH